MVWPSSSPRPDHRVQDLGSAPAAVWVLGENLLSLFLPFPSLKCSYLTETLWRLNKFLHMKHLAQSFGINNSYLEYSNTRRASNDSFDHRPQCGTPPFPMGNHTCPFHGYSSKPFSTDFHEYMDKNMTW